MANPIITGIDDRKIKQQQGQLDSFTTRTTKRPSIRKRRGAN